jgi:hypothetical protein
VVSKGVCVCYTWGYLLLSLVISVTYKNKVVINFALSFCSERVKRQPRNSTVCGGKVIAANLRLRQTSCGFLSFSRYFLIETINMAHIIDLKICTHIVSLIDSSLNFIAPKLEKFYQQNNG